MTVRALGARAIVALDVATLHEALSLVERLGDACDFYKVGSELFTAAGPAVVRQLRERGKEVFLDLKFHDIPNTVRQGARSAAAMGVSLLTVHAVGGSAMLRAAVEGAGGDAGILAVTVLTSLDAAALGEAWGRRLDQVEPEVLRLADLAASTGAHGVVCAGSDAPRVRERFADRLALLVPGIRLTGGEAHDQSRIVTPRTAVEAGANYLVIGRAVTMAVDPAAALGGVLEEMRTATPAPRPG